MMKQMYKQRFGCVNVITSVDFSIVSSFIFLTSELKPLDENKENARKSESKIQDRVRCAANERKVKCERDRIKVREREYAEKVYAHIFIAHLTLNDG